MISWNPGSETFGTILPAYGNAGDLVSGVWFGLVSGRSRGKSRSALGPLEQRSLTWQRRAGSL